MCFERLTLLFGTYLIASFGTMSVINLLRTISAENIFSGPHQQNSTILIELG
jgi:hypothetical protein